MEKPGSCRVGPEPVKSPLDTRTYRSLTLCNGLKVLLISDPEHDKAAAAMDVSVGCFNDPAELPGLAHFLEHMLFLGTKKYPDEASYSQFLAEKGGYSNAYTSMENTNYQFQLVISKSARSVDDVVDGEDLESPLYEALDRFSQFFISPLFTEAATARELNAVNSEHEKNLQNDGRRFFQLAQSCGNPAHPYSNFGTGSKATLWDIPRENNVDTRSALLAFHKKYYSANLMHLCVSSPHSVDTMQKWVVELFSPISNSNVCSPAAEYAGLEPWTEAEMGRVAHVLPIKDMRMLSLSWLIPSTKHAYRSKPAAYVSHLLGHEGKGSLLSLLKSRGWVDALGAGVSLSAEDFGFFDVSMDLTKDGVDHTDEIIEMVFGYIRLLREKGVARWIYEESSALAEMSFRFSERQEPFRVVQQLSSLMSALAESEYISGQYLSPDYEPEKIQGILSAMTPHCVNIMVVGQFVEGCTNATEKWYGTPYRSEPISPEKLSRWSAVVPDAELAIPQKNPFIPKDFTLVASEPLEDDASDMSGPVRILDTDKSELYYKLDRTFRRPKVGVRIIFLTPVSYSSPKSHVLCNLFISLLEDQLTEYSYDAELAGLSYSLYAVDHGIQLAVSGYNDRLNVLAETILEKMVSFRVNPERFAMLFDQWERQWANFDKDQPYQHAMYGISYLLESPRWHVKDYLKSLRRPGEITVDAVNRFASDVLGRLRAVVLVHGNVTEEWAVRLCMKVECALKFDALSAIERPTRRVVELPRDVDIVLRQRGPNPDDRNSAVHISYQVGVRGYDLRRDVLLELLCDVMSKPAFHELRTKQQLGYITFTGIDAMENVRGLYVIIQSTVAGPDELCRRIEDFLAQFRTETLATMTDADFDGFVESSIAVKLEKDKRMSTRSGRFFREICSRCFLFERAVLEADALRKIQKEDLVAFYDEYIRDGAPSRKKVSSLLYGSEHPMSNTASAMRELCAEGRSTSRIVEDTIAFRTSRPLYPASGIYSPFACLETSDVGSATAK